MTRTCHALIVLLSLYGLYSFFGTIFFCVPVSAGWGEAPPDHCMNKGIFYYLCSAANIAFDITIFALPVSLIRALQIPKPQKMGLMFVFTFGAL